MKLDKWHYHEFADRLTVLQDYFEYNILQHPVGEKHFKKQLAKIQDKISKIIGEAPDWKNKK